MINEGSQKATDVRLTQCTLVSSTGVSVGLIEILSELNLFEDLFSAVMTGNLVLNDSNDLINRLPIIGYETLIIQFEKPGSNFSLKKTFRIYKMTDRIRTNEQNETYILHFASEELFLSESILISKTYENMTIAAMITDIAKNYLRILPDKQGIIRETTNLHTITIPGWHPFYAINFLARYALSTFKGAAFLWWEDRDGYHFDSLEYLSTQSPIQSINLSPKNIGFEKDKTKPDLQIQQEGAETIAFPECMDTLKNTYNGMYGGTLITVDPIRRRVQTISYNGLTQFKNSQHVNEFPNMSTAKNRVNRASTDHPESYKVVGIVQSTGNDYMKSKQQLHSNQLEFWKIPRLMYFNGIHSCRISATLPGTPLLQVGKVVSVNLPASTEQTKGGKKLDSLYSGHYLITALRHKIDRKTYSCVVELSKDSLSTPYPEAMNSSIILNLRKR